MVCSWRSRDKREDEGSAVVFISDPSSIILHALNLIVRSNFARVNLRARRSTAGRRPDVGLDR